MVFDDDATYVLNKMTGEVQAADAITGSWLVTMDAQLMTEYDTIISMARCMSSVSRCWPSSRGATSRSKKKGALYLMFHDATWVGYNDRSNEHIVVLKEGRPAIKVRTVRPRAEGERWSAIAIKDIVATPDMPNPKDDSQKDPRSKRITRGLDFGASGQISSKAGCET